MLISKELLIDGHVCDAATADKWVDALNVTCEKFEINTPERIAGFLSQIGHESGGLKLVVESLNYRADMLLRFWPKRFTIELAQAYAMKPEKIANRAYCDKNGNGDEASGEGFKYRGRGLIQLTGKDNYTAFGNACGVDAVSHPEIVESPDVAALSAGWFWSTHRLNALADASDVEGMTRRINGGLNGIDDRKLKYQKLIDYFNKQG